MKKILDGKAELSLVEHNIVKIFVFDYVHLEADDVRNIHRIKMDMINDRAHSVMVVAGKFSSISREAKIVSADDEIAAGRTAKAIVTSNLAQKLVADFFLRFNRPAGLVRIFSCEADALNWLKQLSQ